MKLGSYQEKSTAKILNRFAVKRSLVTGNLTIKLRVVSLAKQQLIEKFRKLVQLAMTMVMSIPDFNQILKP